MGKDVIVCKQEQLKTNNNNEKILISVFLLLQDLEVACLLLTSIHAALTIEPVWAEEEFSSKEY